MTVTTTQLPASAEECESGRRSFEAFLLEGERYLGGGRRDQSGGFAEFLRAVPADLRATIADALREPSRPRDGQRRMTGTSSAAPELDIAGPADSVIRESKSIPTGRVGSIDLFLEELTVDPVPGRRTRRSGDSVFFDVTTIDARGGVAMTGNRVCRRKQCTPALFNDLVLATIEIDQAGEEWPRTISFDVDALEGVNDRIPELIGAARGYLYHEIAGMLADRDGYGILGSVMPSDVAHRVDSHVRAWLDCFIAWVAELVPRSTRSGGEVALGGAQFTATLTGPELSYSYRNLHTARRIELTGYRLVRGRPMTHTFAAAGEEWRARFRLGLRGTATLPKMPCVTDRSRELETVGMGYPG